MTLIGNSSLRTSSLQYSDWLLSRVQQTQSDLQQVQNEISTGKSITKPSDDPTKISGILLLQNRLNQRTQIDQNLQFASSTLNNVDQALSDSTDLVLQAKTVASSQIGVGSDATTRSNQATVIDSIIQGLVDIGNRKYQDISLFSGNLQQANTKPFQSLLGGYQYVGSTTSLKSDLGQDHAVDFNSNGAEAFGAISSRIPGSVDLLPNATANTAISDVLGATHQGVRLGSVVVTVDSQNVTVDLSKASSLGDVVSQINSALNAVVPGSGTLAIANRGFSLTATSGHSITIADKGTGVTASDLGIAITANSASVAGASVDPQLTALTDLTSLGVTVDWASGLKITQGTQSVTVDLSTATTVQDLANKIGSLDMGLRLEINSDGTGLNLVSDVSGVNLSVGENGGTTATDLGLRSFDNNTALSDLNFGLGVSHVQGQADFSVNLHNGTSFQVNLDGANTVGDVLKAISDAGIAAGLTVGKPGSSGTQINVGFATTGNGLVIEDNTTGGNDFKVTQLGTSLAATDLGIYSNAQAGNSIAGADVAQVRVDSLFTHLIALRDALASNNERGITLAGSDIENDLNTLSKARANVGVRSQRVDDQTKRSSDLKLSDQSSLSTLQDADMTAAITRYTQLQQQLTASLQVGAKSLQQTLLDFLR